jgi:hypothetical protein
MTLVPNPVDLHQLRNELAAAGMEYTVLIVKNGEVLGPDAIGVVGPLPPEADAIAAAHVPRSPVQSSRHEVSAEDFTVGVAPKVLYRATIPTTTLYDIDLVVHAIDRGNGNVKKWRRSAIVKRLGSASAPVLVGTVDTPTPDKNDAGSAGWTMVPGFDGNDLVFTVTGAANRTVDWSLFADVRKFTPGGGS